MFRTAFLFTLFCFLGLSTTAMAQKIYWTDSTNMKIHRADLNGSNIEDVVDATAPPAGIVIDSVEQKMYWAELDGANSRLMRANLDGSDAETIHTGDTSGFLAMDEIGRKLYYSSGTTVRRVGLDGSDDEHMATDSTSQPVKWITLDDISQEYFWATENGIRSGSVGLPGFATYLYDSGTRINVVIFDPRSDRLVFNEDTALLWMTPPRFPYFMGHGPIRPRAVAFKPERDMLYYSDSQGIWQADAATTEMTLLFSGISPTGIAVSDPSTCVEGNIEDGAGSATDALYVNGDSRRSATAAGDAVIAAIVQPPAGGTGRFVVHANLGTPTAQTSVDLPGGIGEFCFPMFLNQGAAPAAVWNNLGRESKVGASQYFDGSPIADPPPAPALLLGLAQGDAQYLPPGTAVTFQGVIMDDGATGSQPVSATNAVVLLIF